MAAGINSSSNNSWYGKKIVASFALQYYSN
jgi:hypothetical protein